MKHFLPETRRKGAIRRSKFGVRSSENLKLRTSNLVRLARRASPAWRPNASRTLHSEPKRVNHGRGGTRNSESFTIPNRLYSRVTMDEQEPVQVVELRISYRYVTAHPWVVQAIGGFLSAYFMEASRVSRATTHRRTGVRHAPLGMRGASQHEGPQASEATEGRYSPATPKRSPPICSRDRAISSIALSEPEG